jgi:hypothetical protein
VTQLGAVEREARVVEAMGGAVFGSARVAEAPAAAWGVGRDETGKVAALVHRAAPIVLGAHDVDLGTQSDGNPVGLNLGKLIEGRLLIQGNSGAGKSRLLRRIFEQAFGRVQQLLIDPDGEFASLKDEFDVAVIEAEDIARIGGRAFAHHLREHRYSAVADLSDATGEERLEIAAEIAGGLIDAPPAHWHPLLVLIDEAQTFAPHYDTGDVEKETRKRAIAGLADLMGRGRKRGVAGILATQRLAETSKAVAAKATNAIVGRTFLDMDLERAGALLGFTAGMAKALRTLGDGEFLGVGPALGGRRVRFRSGPVKSRHKGATPELSAPPAVSAAAAAALIEALPAAAEPARVPNAEGKRVRGRGFDSREDEIIIAAYREGLPVRDVCDRLAAAGFRRRSLGGVSGRARSLGVISVRSAAQWSDEEDAILVEAYGREVRIADIVELMREKGYERGRVSIQMRAITLGITRDRVNYWTEPEKAIAIAGLEGGKPYREIIEDLREAGYHRGVNSILKFAQKNNFNRAGERWSPEQIERLRELYAAKTPVKAIAEELDKPIGSVRTRASNLGLKQRVAWTDAEYAILRKGSEDGERLVDVAAKIGRRYPNVAAVASKLGLSFRRSNPHPAGAVPGQPGKA